MFRANLSLALLLSLFAFQPKIKADPALAADCLADGKKWLDKNAADAASELKQDPQFFRDGG